jgi:PAS domain S-box-containing protein
MVEHGKRSRWLSRLLVTVAVIAVVGILLAAWWSGARSPERQAKRWALVQLQSMRQGRDRILEELRSLDQEIRLLAEDPEICRPSVDLAKVTARITRSHSGQEVDWLHAQRFSLDGELDFEVRAAVLGTERRFRRVPDDLPELLDWAQQLANRKTTNLSLERAADDAASDTRVWIRFIAPLINPEDDRTTSLLVLRFPVKEFLAAYLLPTHLLPESYSFVIERDRPFQDVTFPASVVWHSKNPRWADVYLSDTEPFVQGIMSSLLERTDEGYSFLDIPQSDESVRREIVSTLPISVGNRRWIVGLATPYSEAVMSTRSQQSFMILLGGMTLAVLTAGLVLLNYQRTQIEMEAAADRRDQVQRIQHNYQELFAENPTAMLVLGLDGRVQDCNRTAEQFIHRPLAEVRGQPLRDLVSPGAIDPLWRRLAEQGHLPSTDTRFVRERDGKEMLVEIWGRRIGEQIVLIAQDVEQRRDFERQMSRLRRMDSVGSLASTMAHDFNNILGQVQILISNLRADLNDDSPLMEDLITIENKIDDASQLVGNLLSSRENVMADNPVYPEPVLREFVQQQQRLLPSRVRFTADIRPDLPSIWLSPTSLRRILDNLVINACDAMPEGGTLTIRARARHIEPHEATDQLRSDHYCVVEVADTGVGMSSEMLDAIFEPFFSTKSEGKGSGLGLWTIYKILRRSRGAIHVHSQLGQGTRFTLYLSHAKPSEDIDSPGLEMARPNR